MKNQASLKQKIFGLDNKFMRIATKIFNLMILNLSFLISCLPIVTIGPALVTIYRVAGRLREEPNMLVIQEYWNELKNNWKQGGLLGGVSLLIIVSVYLNIRIFSNIAHPTAFVLQVISYGIGFISLIVGLYAFQISGQFQSSFTQTIKNAFLLSFLNFLKTIQLIVPIIFVTLLLMLSPLTMLLTLSILLFIGLALIAYVQTKIIEPVFKKYQ
ncbi:hypothetical protein GCM10011482_09070 [Enterococcus alcedinis]|uniref:DUF624 domain-containing protein n=1 Tax=Enterococcus alcedinis TaxID=1274384 RepID=A0A917N457_9ENTE|nr:DUF624 domain-containing protein [Enterococcus alcedinis]MBP2101355.1 putative membrane protein YesL [Enterococcus alcedinis]GGI65253.1 hypothetical protein GCM10011482_09070 [Enterococcus alcedinis]